MPLSTQDIEVPASESVAVTLSLPALSESKGPSSKPFLTNPSRLTPQPFHTSLHTGFFAPRRCFNTLSPTISCVYCYFLLVYRWFVCHLIEIQEHEWMNVGVLQITVTREKSAMTEDVKGNDGVVTDSNITLKSSSTTPLPKWLELPPGVLGQLRIVTQISKLSTGELQRMSFNPSR